MRYLSVCSGIEAASVAWHDLFECAAMSEIEPFPREVLRHHYPSVPLHGDFTTIGESDYGETEILVGGTPCQSFSVAGLRGGLADDRGNLALEFCRLAARKKPRWILWENVPGCLSSNGGRDFGSILGGLAECGYGFAYRVLDAQFVRVESHPYAVPQRRRRVFVVGYLGDWRPPAAVLLERESVRRHSEPRREARCDNPAVSHALLASGNSKWDATRESFITLRGENVASTLSHRYDSLPCTDRGQDVIGFSSWNDAQGAARNISPSMRKSDSIAVAFSCKDSGSDASNDIAQTMRSMSNNGSHANGGGQLAVASGRNMVRRLTPLECERLQGYPDGYTDIMYRGKRACDGPRYKALGNSMAVNVMRWLGLRIKQVDEILERLPRGNRES